MEIRVNPTRMELNRLKKRLTMAKRGHKLLKDKRDELIRQFIIMIKENEELRRQVEEALSAAFAKFLLARAVMPLESIEGALMYPTRRLSLKITRKNIMSVYAPQFTWGETESAGEGGTFPYGFADTSADLDVSIETLSNIMPQLSRLAEVEKATQLLAVEIEKTRRRVNALEYVLIPQMEETIRYITMKLEENERAALTRLMKIKDVVRAN